MSECDQWMTYIYTENSSGSSGFFRVQSDIYKEKSEKDEIWFGYDEVDKKVKVGKSKVGKVGKGRGK